MKAKVKSEHRWASVTAFSGMEFVKSEYRPVPAGREKEAQAHPFLEVIADKEVIKPEPVEEAVIVTGDVAEEPVVIPAEGLSKPEKTADEKAAWAAKMAKARADKKAKGG